MGCQFLDLLEETGQSRSPSISY